MVIAPMIDNKLRSMPSVSTAATLLREARRQQGAEAPMYPDLHSEPRRRSGPPAATDRRGNAVYGPALLSRRVRHFRTRRRAEV